MVYFIENRRNQRLKFDLCIAWLLCRFHLIEKETNVLDMVDSYNNHTVLNQLWIFFFLLLRYFCIFDHESINESMLYLIISMVSIHIVFVFFVIFSSVNTIFRVYCADIL